MAKSKKVKPTETIVEEPKVDIPQEPVVETPVVNTEDIPAPIPDVIPVVTATAEPELVGIKKYIISEVEPLYTPEQAKEIVEKWEGKEELPTEQKILNYLEGKEGEVRINDFLKSLYGVSKFNEPPMWQNQGVSKEMKNILSNIHNSSVIS